MKTTARVLLTAVAMLILTGSGVSVFPGPASGRDRADVKPPQLAGPQEAEVMAVVMDQRTQQPTIMLQGKRDRRTLAMAIGVAEATGIAVPLQGVTPPRPLTHDLFITLFGRLKVAVTRVVITDLRNDIYYANVYLTSAAGEMMLDSRPSDAIALAIRAKVPVFVEDRVFDKGGSEREAPRPHI